MLKEKAGVIAGTIWNALNETEGMTAKQLKKATKLVDKDLFLPAGMSGYMGILKYYMRTLSLKFVYNLEYGFLISRYRM